MLRYTHEIFYLSPSSPSFFCAASPNLMLPPNENCPGLATFENAPAPPLPFVVDCDGAWPKLKPVPPLPNAPAAPAVLPLPPPKAPALPNPPLPEAEVAGVPKLKPVLPLLPLGCDAAEPKLKPLDAAGGAVEPLALPKEKLTGFDVAAGEEEEPAPEEEEDELPKLKEGVLDPKPVDAGAEEEEAGAGVEAGAEEEEEAAGLPKVKLAFGAENEGALGELLGEDAASVPKPIGFAAGLLAEASEEEEAVAAGAVEGEGLADPVDPPAGLPAKFHP